MLTPRRLKELYEQGHNISATLRELAQASSNTEGIIEASYDLQAGSYVAAMSDPAKAHHQAEYTRALAQVVLDVCQPLSILEAGVGEATTLSGVLNHLGALDRPAFGFDISWSRVATAKQWLAKNSPQSVSLCTGSLLHMPFLDDSVDVVYTSHSIEPNGGAEEPILRELFRVARSYLVLLEPGYELAGEEARRRMETHGYCRDLPGVAESLGFKVIRHGLFPFSINPLNPTALTIIEKRAESALPSEVLACPQFKSPLLELGGMLFSQEALCVYPVLEGIPCLRRENAITASLFPDIVSQVQAGQQVGP